MALPSNAMWMAMAGFLLLVTTAVSRSDAQPQSQAASESTSPIVIRSVTRIRAAANIPARASGVLTEIGVREGDYVKKEDLLAKIHSDAAQLRYERARLEFAVAERLSKDNTPVQYAEKSLEVARADLARSEGANQSIEQAVSDTELDRQRLIVSKSRLEVDKAKLESEVTLMNRNLREVDLRESRFELSRHEIRSPIDGCVVRIERQTGEWIETGEVALRVVQLDRLWVEGWVGVEIAMAGIDGKTVEVIAHVPNRDDISCRGQIIFVSPEANPVDGKILVRAEISNPDGILRPGLQADIIVPR